MYSFNILQSLPTPLVAAALGLVDENQGSSHLVPGANLEHHPLLDRSAVRWWNAGKWRVKVSIRSSVYGRMHT